MADDRQRDPEDQPDDESSNPSGESSGNPSGEAADSGQPFQLGPKGGAGSGSSGSGSGSSGSGPVGFGGQPGAGQPGAGGNPQNPFEALFGQFGSSGSGDMNQMMEQLQNAFSMLGGGGSMFGAPGGQDTGSGVNWEITKDTARKTVASLGEDPTPTDAQRRAISEAASIAEVWLDEATSFPRVSSSVVAWSRAEWVENTMSVWQRLVEPVADHIADAMEGALSFGDGDEAGAIPGMQGMEQMLRPMLRTSGASMFGLQLGQALGRLATEVVGATDIGLPLSEDGQVALLPANVAKFGEGLDQSSTDVTLYLALRESARQRLFSHAGWVREQILTLVEEYARGITIDTSALEQAVGQIDPNNLEELSQSLEGGLFEPQKTPQQQATLERLETMLALVEGWVDEVVSQATAQWMPSASALAETVRRRRVTGGPAEATFATLVGLELRPRRMRDAANLWAAVRDKRGAEGRDAVWTHPDLIPATADLDDPLGFVSGEAKTEDADDFDEALARLLDEDTGDSGTDDPGKPDPGKPDPGKPDPGKPE